jgi:hypothetical protein
MPTILNPTTGTGTRGPNGASPSEHVNDTDVIWIDIEADPHRAVILLDWDVRACHDVCRGAGGGAGGLAKAG